MPAKATLVARAATVATSAAGIDEADSGCACDDDDDRGAAIRVVAKERGSNAGAELRREEAPVSGKSEEEAREEVEGEVENAEEEEDGRRGEAAAAEEENGETGDELDEDAEINEDGWEGMICRSSAGFSFWALIPSNRACTCKGEEKKRNKMKSRGNWKKNLKQNHSRPHDAMIPNQEHSFLLE